MLYPNDKQRRQFMFNLHQGDDVVIPEHAFNTAWNLLSHYFGEAEMQLLNMKYIEEKKIHEISSEMNLQNSGNNLTRRMELIRQTRMFDWFKGNISAEDLNNFKYPSLLSIGVPYKSCVNLAKQGYLFITDFRGMSIDDIKRLHRVSDDITEIISTCANEYDILIPATSLTSWSSKFLGDVYDNAKRPSNFDLNFVIFCNDLEQRERTIVELYYKDGINMSKIADVIGCSRERVRQLLKRIKRKANTSKYKQLFFGESACSVVIDATDLDSIPIHTLDISTRLMNCLVLGGYKTLGDLRGVSRLSLSRIRGFGVGCYDELVNVLSTYDISLS